MSNRQYTENSSDDGLTVGQLDAAVQDRQRSDADSGAATGRFILLYALAWAGGTIAYTPLLTILLPVRIEALVGRTVGIDWLAYIAFAGAIAASIGGILFGWLSDITANRRGWIWAGLILSSALLIIIGRLHGLTELIIVIVLWQLALNMMLGPLAAWAGDIVPDERKGWLGGLLAWAPGFGALSGALVTQPGLAQHDVRTIAIAVMVIICVVPVLFLPGMEREAARSDDAAPQQPEASPNQPVLRMWSARLAIQLAEATLFAYLFFWLAGLDPGFTDNDTARIFTAITLVSAPLALLVGRWSDRVNHPIRPLIYAALVAAFGLAMMALATNVTAGIIAYALFGLACAVFLALHAAQTLRILPRPSRRGRDLGLFNLANTVPSLVMPWLAMLLLPRFGFAALFLLMAGLALIAAGLLRGLRRTATPST